MRVYVVELQFDPRLYTTTLGITFECEDFQLYKFSVVYIFSTKEVEPIIRLINFGILCMKKTTFRANLLFVTRKREDPNL